VSLRAKPASLLGELGLGLALSLVAAAVGATLPLILPNAVALRTLIGLLGFLCVLHRLGLSGDRTGRVAVMALWSLVTIGAWLLGLSVGAFLAVQAALLWLVRSLYTYSSLLATGKDLAISALALAFAFWAALRTESVFLAAWSFFLVQALHVFFADTRARDSGPPACGEAGDAFESAHRAAETALARLARRAR
jgi:hypothetical protein